MSHLGRRISALVDGQLDHEARDRALAHVAHCAGCRRSLAAERALKDRLATAAGPEPPPALVQRLLGVAEQRESSSPARVAGRRPPSARRLLRRPSGRSDFPRPSAARTGRRSRYAAAGVLSVGAVILGTAFAVGGGAAAGAVPVVPPAAELSVEHAATSAGLPLRDPAFDAVTASFGGLTFAPPPTPAAKP